MAAPPVADWVERFTQLMDEAIRIPGTNIRFGVDALLGLIPGIGDAVSAAASLSVIGLAIREGVPVLVLLRMVLNVGIDAVVGAIPALGTVFDVFYKANRRNLTLLEGYRRGEGMPRRDTALVGLVLLLLAMLLALPVLLGLALTSLLVSLLV
ncbi:MAG TPA: DUF4112 domain-containing protein [Polyangiaceae bacterium LLY-WYZ-14_1]|nr:DUF4112 domain-containing protein [Polyangiaceae bacterium LLY-WYZ-14_1]